MINLSLRCARRPEDEGDHLARQKLYLADLKKYPEPVALKALEAAAEQQWFPTWNEMLRLLHRYSHLAQRGPDAETVRLEAPARLRRDHERVEEYTATVMRSELGQRALAEQWARFLWDFLVERGRVPSDAEAGNLTNESRLFDEALAQCDRPELWGTTPPRYGTMRPIGEIAGRAKELKSLGLTMLAKEGRLSGEFGGA